MSHFCTASQFDDWEAIHEKENAMLNTKPLKEQQADIIEILLEKISHQQSIIHEQKNEIAELEGLPYELELCREDWNIEKAKIKEKIPKWRPMSEAPTDGTPLLVYNKEGQSSILWTNSRWDSCVLGWMPLPPPPKPTAEEATAMFMEWAKPSLDGLRKIGAKVARYSGVWQWAGGDDAYFAGIAIHDIPENITQALDAAGNPVIYLFEDSDIAPFG